jgi:hypothetical protein
MGDTSPQQETELADPMADAARLADDGQVLEAIRLLTDANRMRRDPRIEERLVTLRHDAFTSLRRHPTTDPPAEVLAEEPDGPLAPTDPHDLTVAALRRGLAQHGCVLVRGLIPTRRAEALARGIDQALDAFDCCAAALGRQAAPWYVPFSPRTGEYRVGGRRGWVRASGALWTADSPRMLFELLQVVDETGIGALVEAYLGERPALSANKCTLRRVPVDTNTNWHQDGAFLGLDLVPRRLDEVLPTGTDGALFDWSVSPTLVAEAANGHATVVRPSFSPGDALLFDHLFLHRTGVDPGMTRERWAIETWFFAPSTYPEGQIPLAY